MECFRIDICNMLHFSILKIAKTGKNGRYGTVAVKLTASLPVEHKRYRSLQWYYEPDTETYSIYIVNG